MNSLPPRRAPWKKRMSAALLPILLLSPFFGAFPAAAQVEVGARSAALGEFGAVRPVPAAVGAIQGPAVLSAPSSLSPIPGAFLAPSAPVAAAPALALAPAAAAAASIPAAPSDRSPSSAAPAARPFSAARLPRSAAASSRAFGSFLKSLASVHAPLAESLSGSKLFDGVSPRGILSPDAFDAFANPGEGVDSLPAGLPKRSSLRAAGAVEADAASAPEEAASGIPLDADPADPASIEKALRAIVDSAPEQFGAPSAQLGKVSVSVLPSILPGHGASILAVFRQTLSGADKDGSPYRLSVEGKSVAFHIKVFPGAKPAVMSITGRLASGVSADVMNAAFDEAQLAEIAARRAKLPVDRAPGSAAREDILKWLPRGGLKSGAAAAAEAASAREAAPSAARFLTRELTDQFDGKWRAVNIYQASDPRGEPVIVVVDVKSGEAFAFGAKDLHTGNEAETGRRHLLSGSATGRATLPTADGGDHGPIGPVALPLTNVYDEAGKVVAVTDEQGNFSIPDDGRPGPVKLTIRLASPLVPFVKDEDEKENGPVEVTVLAKPGEKMTVRLNPASDNPELAANIVGYVGYLNHHLWMKNLPGMDAARMDVPLAGGIVVNGHAEKGNAFYDPSTDSVNLMAAAVITVHDSQDRPVELKVENTAVWSIEDHEDTHRVVQIFSQLQLTPEQKASAAFRFVKWSMDTIMGSDVNEAIADAVSYFMRHAAIIGDHFIGNPRKGQADFIRSALEKTPYDPKNPDPHNGVLAQAMWSARLGFIAALGEEKGSAYANAMIPLIVIAQPLNPVDALMHMLLWDMREDGTSPFSDLIRRIARDDHGIELPALPVPPPQGVPAS
ncbi:MAG: hypothetical protein ACHQ49_07245 [Elusimicrobiota bacterium]